MAFAQVIYPTTAYIRGDTGDLNAAFQFSFIGADVPGGYAEAQILIDLSQIPVPPDPAQIAAMLAAQVRAYATSQGFTVPPNFVNLPMFQLG